LNNHSDPISITINQKSKLSLYLSHIITKSSKNPKKQKRKIKLKNPPEIKIKNYQTTFAETSQVEN
jgi:hypothetical protein